MKILMVLFVLISSSIVKSEEAKIEGRWKQFDDESKELSSIVEISENNGEWSGKIIEIFKTSNEETLTTVCQDCTGEFKDKKIVGLKFIWGMKKKSQFEYTDGQILDPNNGSTYKCKMILSEDGQQLDVRGFIGISLLGRTQTWKKIP